MYEWVSPKKSEKQDIEKGLWMAGLKRRKTSSSIVDRFVREKLRFVSSVSSSRHLLNRRVICMRCSLICIQVWCPELHPFFSFLLLLHPHLFFFFLYFILFFYFYFCFCFFFFYFTPFISSRYLRT